MAQILIVDDSPFTRRQLKKALVALGHEVSEAGDGAEALAALDTQRPDIIFTDLLMPNMNGFELIDHLHQRTDGTENTPTVVLTADIQDSNRGRCEELGATTFLNKPVKAAAIEAIMDELLPGLQATR